MRKQGFVWSALTSHHEGRSLKAARLLVTLAFVILLPDWAWDGIAKRIENPVTLIQGLRG